MPPWFVIVRGLLKLTWLEIKIFVREPLGFVGSVGIPVLLFIVLARSMGGRPAPRALPTFVANLGVPVFAALFIALSAVASLVTIIAIYREGGILKRLRATPLRPQTILLSHVLVKLLLTAVTVVLMVLAGRSYFPVTVTTTTLQFVLALLISTVSILSIGFVIASLVPVARFAQPIAAAILYPMVALSGLFVAIESLPGPLQVIARIQPMTYAVSLLSGTLKGEPWTAHVGDLGALALITVVATVLSGWVFRWE